MTDQLRLRHWQQIKQAQALEYAGTPDGNAALVESRRYGLAADRIEELVAEREFDQRNAAMSQSESAMLLDKREALAAQVEVMRGALKTSLLHFSVFRDSRFWRGGDEIAVEACESALAMQTTAAILRQRHARVYREAADDSDAMYEGQVGAVRVASMRCADALRDRADELERKK